MDIDGWFGRGPFTAGEAHLEGLTASDIERLVRSKALVQLRRGVYVSAVDLGAVANDDPRLHAMHIRGLQLAFASPVAAAASSAARIYGLEFLDPPVDELVVVSGDTRTSGTHRDGYRLRVAVLPEAHLTERHGVTLTTPARTVVDLCAELSFMGGVVIAESAVRKRLTTVEELRETADTTVSRRGITRVRRVFDFLGPQSDSPLESASRVRIAELQLGTPATQVEFVINGRLIRVDFYWAEFDLVGEADGYGKYQPKPGQDALAAVRDEKEREQLLLAAGKEVVRWGWREVRRPELLQARLQPAFTRGLERRRGRFA